jgi:hypothetical protein
VFATHTTTPVNATRRMALNKVCTSPIPRSRYVHKPRLEKVEAAGSQCALACGYVTRYTGRRHGVRGQIQLRNGGILTNSRRFYFVKRQHPVERRKRPILFLDDVTTLRHV